MIFVPEMFIAGDDPYEHCLTSGSLTATGRKLFTFLENPPVQELATEKRNVENVIGLTVYFRLSQCRVYSNKTGVKADSVKRQLMNTLLNIHGAYRC